MNFMKREDKLVIPTFLKWAGGKQQLLQQYAPLFPDRINSYVEPFVGGGAVLFYVLQQYQPKRVVAMDINPQLINCFNAVKRNPRKVIAKLNIHKRNHDERYYYKVRAIDVSSLSDVEQASRFIYLNKTCWNGLHRVNSQGLFNVPIGKYVNPQIFNKDTLISASNLLSNVRLVCAPFQKVRSFANKNSFVYFDPPYYPLSATSSFTDYYSSGFGKEDHSQLKVVAEQLNAKECKVMISNSNVPFIRNLYFDWTVKRVTATRFLNCNAEKRGEISELVVRNYD